MEIEPKIKPLVDALNNTNLCCTFSSCQGHYSVDEQESMDRNHADVRFDPNDNISTQKLDSFITFLVAEFGNRHSFAPITLKAYKLYTPNEDYSPDYVYVIELTPFDRFERAENKRKMTDDAILQTIEIVNSYKS